MTPVGLTARQQQLHAFIVGRISQGLTAPSYSEMRAHLGLRSKSGVHRLVECLVERGHLVRMPNRARALALPQAEPTLAPPPERPRIGISRSMAERVVVYCDRRGEVPREIVSRALVEYMRRNP